MIHNQKFNLAFILLIAVTISTHVAADDCCKPGETKPDQDDCAKYFVCCTGEFKPMSCLNGEYFNADLGKCVKDNGECKCNGTTCVDGDKKADTSNCANYLLCTNGEYQTVSCGSGNYWNVQAKQCQKDNGICVTTPAPTTPIPTTPKPTTPKPTTTKSTTPTPTTPCPSTPTTPVPTTPKPTTPTQLPQFQRPQNHNTKTNNTKTNNPNSNNPMPINSNYPSSNNSKTNNTKTNNPKTYNPMPINSNSNNPMLNNIGKYVAQVCSSGNYWNAEAKQCQKDNGNCVSTPTPSPTTPATCVEGDFKSDSNSCDGYYKCINGIYVAQVCDSGDYWDAFAKECQKNNGYCPPPPPTPPTCEEGDVKENPSNCAGFYHSNYPNSNDPKTNNTKTYNNKINNPNSNNPMPINSNYPSSNNSKTNYPNSNDPKTNNTKTNNNKINNPNSNNPMPINSNYPSSNNSKTNNTNCNYPKTNNTKTNNTKTNNTNSNNPMPINSNYPSSNNSKTNNTNSNYPKTNNTKTNNTKTNNTNSNNPMPINSNYPSSNNPKTNNTNSNYPKTNNPKTNNTNSNNSMPINSNYPSSNNPKTNHTNSNYPKTNNTKTNNTNSNNPMPINSNSNNPMLNNLCRGRCQGESFELCRILPVYRWKICCPATCVEGDVKENPSNCAGFYQCIGGKYVAQVCGSGNYWNAVTKQCEKDNGSCVTTPTPSTPTPTRSTTTPATCVEGDVKENPSNCAGFYQCISGKYVAQVCGSGNYWNAVTKQCEKDNGYCVTTPTTPSTPTPQNCVEGDKEVNPANCAGYLECINNVMVKRQCPANTYFDNSLSVCVFDVDGICIPKVCDPECCDRPNDWLGPVDKNCSAFIQCLYGNKYQQRCPNNLQFNNVTKECDFPENVQCDDGTAPPSGPTAGPSGTYCESKGRCVGKSDGAMMADATDVCSGSYVVCQCECEVNFKCSAGLVFNTKIRSCDWPANANC
ncbi:hypothetical protein ACLKA6_002774 [Drosophila palustris]